MRISDWSSDVCSSDLFAIDVIVGDDRDLAVRQRQQHGLADQMCVTLILGMNGNCRITEHRLRARGRDDDMMIAVRSLRAVCERIAKMPELAVLLLADDFEIGDCGQQYRVPVDEARSEEHTSELQSLMRISYAVFCLKKKKK